jgi:hypothetical protein
MIEIVRLSATGKREMSKHALNIGNAAKTLDADVRADASLRYIADDLRRLRRDIAAALRVVEREGATDAGDGRH